MKKICLQAGHANKVGGGAPEEQSNNKRITDRLTAVLRDRGYEVYQTDWYANNDTKVTGTDWDLFLALHCDMDYPNDGGSGFADYADPSTNSVTNESQRICKIINETYFPEVKINYISHSNANTRFYYMWKYLTPKTPCVLLEMGQSIDPHDKVLLANTDLIANAIAKCIDKAFGSSIPTNEIDPLLKYIKENNLTEGKIREAMGALADIENKNKEISTLKTLIESLSLTVKNLNGKLSEEQKSGLVWQSDLETAKKQISKLEGDMTTLAKDRNQYKKWYGDAKEDLRKLDKMTGWQHIRFGIKLISSKK